MNRDWTFYEVLGVREDASADDIKAAFRKLALAHHPDRNLGNRAAEARFKTINEAYSVLGEATKRTAYDERLGAARSSEAAARRARYASEAPNRAPNNQNPAPHPVPAYTPPPAAPSGWGALFAAVLGVGLAAAVASADNSDSWDSRAGRYRGPDGRFTSG